MWLRVYVVVLLTSTPSFSVGLTWKVAASIWLSYLIKQGTWVGVLPGSLALGSLVILYWLLFSTLQGIPLTYVLVMKQFGLLGLYQSLMTSVPSSSGSSYTHYLAHWVLRQFDFDKDIPPVFKDIVPSLPSLDLFLRVQTFSYWLRRTSQFVVPNS